MWVCCRLDIWKHTRAAGLTEGRQGRGSGDCIANTGTNQLQQSIAATDRYFLAHTGSRANLRAGRAAAVVTAVPQLAENSCNRAMRPLADLTASKLLAS